MPAEMWLPASRLLLLPALALAVVTIGDSCTNEGNPAPPALGFANIRVVHLSSGGPALDVFLDGGEAPVFPA